ncbi:MAG: hypothetical protein AAGI38_01140 [Bacteroidota bacterium]
MLSDSVQTEIITFIESTFPTVFVVRINFKSGKKNILQVRVDTDQGISMETCALIARKLGPWLDEEDLLPGDYGMEVSSPGIGEAIVLPRQYRKNVDRFFRVRLTSGEHIEGKLISSNEVSLKLLPLAPKSKQVKGRPTKFLEQERTLEFDQIEESKVILL